MNSRSTVAVTLLSDFGTADGYVAAMKGVIVSLAPNALIVDATHEIPPQDICAGAWALGTYWRWYPRGSIHVAVVDPGVGTEREALLVVADGRFLLAPDNGLLCFALQQAAEVQLRRLRPDVHHPAGKSATFHGRDVFAYAAGLLARGESSDAISEPLDGLVMPSRAGVQRTAEALVGEVVHVDRFGNLITSITRRQVAELGWREAVAYCGAAHDIPVVETYGRAAPGALVAVFGSADTLEIAVVRGSAAARLRLGCRAAVEVREKKNSTTQQRPGTL